MYICISFTSPTPHHPLTHLPFTSPPLAPLSPKNDLYKHRRTHRRAVVAVVVAVAVAAVVVAVVAAVAVV
jgi:hypothetical protein